MNLDNNALFKAAGIGAAAVLVLTLLSQIPLVGIACCCVLWLSYLGIGALYGVFAKQNGALISAGPLALGGALAAAIAGIVQGIISSIVSLLFTSEAAMAEALAQLEAQGMEVPPEMLELYTGTGFGIASALIGICMALFIGAILGAIGGAIYGATQQGRGPVAPAYESAPPPPPAPSSWDRPSEPPASSWQEPTPPEPPASSGWQEGGAQVYGEPDEPDEPQG